MANCAYLLSSTILISLWASLLLCSYSCHAAHHRFLHHELSLMQSSVSEPKGFVLGLKHRDFVSSANSTFAQSIQSAIERSRRRLSHFRGGSMTVSRKDGGKASRSGFEARITAGDGAFLTGFYLGTPAANVTAIVDTGSDLVWQQCQPCESCFNQPDALFDPSMSTTYRTASCEDKLCQALPQMSCDGTCQYSYLYGDNSATSGELGYDTLTLKDQAGHDSKIQNFGFGCGHDNVGESFANSDGLLGLGQGPLSLTSQISTNKFSYCLGGFMSTDASPLFLGEAATMDEGSNVQVTPLITNSELPSFYYLDLQGISLDGTLLGISSETFALQSDGTGGLIIDSGTTITYLENSGYQVILKAIDSAVRLPKVSGNIFGLDLCYYTAGEVPSLTLHFDGADMKLPSENLFISVGGLYCLAMGSSTGVSILGNIQQQNYHFLFDQGSRKVSFAQTTCNGLLPQGV